MDRPSETTIGYGFDPSNAGFTEPMSRILPTHIALIFACSVVLTGPIQACSGRAELVSNTDNLVTLGGERAGSSENLSVSDQPKELVMAAGDVDPKTQLAGSWIVSEIGTNNISPDSGITLDFSGYNLAVSAPCNHVEATVKYGDIGIGFESVSAGEKICDSETMAIETALLAAIESIDRFEMGEGDMLTFFASDTPVLRAHH